MLRDFDPSLPLNFWLVHKRENQETWLHILRVYRLYFLSHSLTDIGTLCGECIEPYGVGMLSMECRKFTAEVNMYYWLIPMLG